jgi:hypothetical protein
MTLTFVDFLALFPDKPRRKAGVGEIILQKWGVPTCKKQPDALKSVGDIL